MMAQLPPPSFDPQALLPMPGRRAARLTRDVQSAARQLIGDARALPSQQSGPGLSMLSLRAGGAAKAKRRR